MEEWQTIKEYPRYSVSSKGKVRNDKTGRILKGNPATNGYLHVNICSKTKYIHHLVAKYFLGERPANTIINHKDGNKVNNDHENLEYISQKQHLRQHSKFYGEGRMKNFMLRNIAVDLHTRLKLLAVKRSATEGREIFMREIILEAIQEKLDSESDPKQ